MPIWALKQYCFLEFPEHKDEVGSSACQSDGVVQKTIEALKRDVPDLTVITDLCFCEYTSHGHCGIMKDGELDNDATLKILAEQSLSHAQAGADVIAPSGMLDGDGTCYPTRS